VTIFFRIPAWLLLGAVIFIAGCGPSPETTGPVFTDAWVRAIPPGMKMTAGFGVLSNPESAAIEITSFTSPSFGDVSFHRTEVVDGIAKMREMPVLSIAAGATIVLEPGAFHLMFMMPSADIQPGQVIVVEMTAADGRSFSFDMPVERR
jgi:copper(I)-binding protein